MERGLLVFIKALHTIYYDILVYMLFIVFNRY